MMAMQIIWIMFSRMQYDFASQNTYGVNCVYEYLYTETKLCLTILLAFCIPSNSPYQHILNFFSGGI